MSIVEFKNVCFSYSKELLLEGVNFTIEDKEFCTIVGPNGSGKTTLLKLLLGLYRPQKGRIVVFGGNPLSERINIGYMPQSINYDPHFPITVMEVVMMGRLHGGIFRRYQKNDYFAAECALNDLEILNLKNRTFSELSGGQRKRVLIARALACKPKLLIFDEPIANVDSLVESKLFEIMKKLNEKMAIIMVSHNIKFVADIVEKVICVDRHVAVHPTSNITKEFIDELTRGHYKMIKHDHCDHAEKK